MILNAFFILIFGFIIGSFLNVIIYRLPIMLFNDWTRDCCDFLKLKLENYRPDKINLLYPRSFCVKCKKTIKITDNVPILSYILLGGRCRYCRQKISSQYFLVELITGLLFVACYLKFSNNYYAVFAAAILISYLITITFIDLEHQIIPDELTMPILWLGLLINYFFNLFTDYGASLIGAAGGYLILWGFYQVYKLITNKEGMGHGDFKLLACLGAWLGWQMLPLIIFLSSGLGAIFGVAWLLIQKKNKSTPIAFGPYLAVAGMIALFFGNNINQTYLWFLQSA